MSSIFYFYLPTWTWIVVANMGTSQPALLVCTSQMTRTNYIVWMWNLCKHIYCTQEDLNMAATRPSKLLHAGPKYKCLVFLHE